MYVLVAEDHVSISPEQEVGLLMAESEICKVGVEKLLPLPLSLPSFLGDGSIQPLSEINHKGRSEVGGDRVGTTVETTCPLDSDLQTRPREAAKIIFQLNQVLKVLLPHVTHSWGCLEISGIF